MQLHEVPLATLHLPLPLEILVPLVLKSNVFTLSANENR